MDMVADILKRNQLSVTDTRKRILEFFHRSSGALAHADIEKMSGEHFDRVTIYRTLQTFVEKGIIHAIPTADNSVRYALCKDNCAEGHHHDNHVHFMCDRCGTTFCLDHTGTPLIQLPGGFTGGQVNVLVSGICKTCNMAL
ncbi:MAG TPA: transcriptional repressor [Chitinophagaceae bacterium]|jgi:Fur family ferric uptake transcriptional regulator|nr:transcriptional repressor [Chitinophagaceae bacterium]